ncbi:tRNA pseudouridine synthase B [Legionella birminghamensis]|uniref:tRNA pseudouridine synthase B n=1 Tax=Legionella birminghamensis TaxID=28083 RepID=A0A378I771_9GAMM|nr:tRNA pseudouridine(55) synthase TruB [Legionella birminghamensis]KTC72463.1 tRNA pseudouridine synthase B [Legionella birminghamensis]STX30595.1 tRNA pseudouridine synthase B [Legionella birminghamensis]
MKRLDLPQPVNGILLLNKPQGLSSNAVLQKAKRLLNAKKAGHTGSLDPLATGMLPLCFGEATKVCQYLLDADKTYQATGRLGIKTDSGDSTGSIIAELSCLPSISQIELQAVISQFIGSIEQTPSMYSALKYQGQPLYKYARRGQTVERKKRTIDIYYIKLLHFDGSDFSIEVSCSKGTYIRSLIEDIGEMLGVYAHMTQLHRLHTAGFNQMPMYSFEELANHDDLQPLLLPMENAIAHLPLVELNDEELQHLRQGKIVQRTIDNHTGLSRLYSSDGQFTGIGELLENGCLQVKRLLAF